MYSRGPARVRLRCLNPSRILLRRYALTGEGSEDEQQDHRAYEGHQRAADPSLIAMSQESSEQPAARKGAENTDEEIAEHSPRPLALNDHPGAEARHDADDDPENEMVHLTNLS